MITYDINRPWLTLDDWQKEYIFDPVPNQNNFLLTGRQVGKTAAMSMRAVELCVNHFKKGEFVLINSITEKQAYHMLAKALTYAEEKYRGRIMKDKDNKPTKHRIMFENGSGILCYAAGDTGEGLRGFTIKKLMPDEGARMSEEYFVAVIPMLSVIDGSMDIASTPHGTKHKDGEEKFFYKCSKDEKFKKYYISGEDCPRHSKEFLEDCKKRMTKLQYAQEFLAQFLDQVQQFLNPEWIKKCCVGKRPELIPKYGDNFIGCDVARKGIDKFTYEIFNRTGTRGNYKLTQIENIYTTNVPIPESTRRIISLNTQYNFKKEYIDSGGMGITVCDLLREDQVNKNKVVEINNASRRFVEDGKERKTGILKEDLYKNLAVLMEKNQVELLDDDEVIASLSSLQYEYSDAGKLIIWGYDDHIAEGITRGCWASKDKSLKPFIY